jgi:hypothetical protein
VQVARFKGFGVPISHPKAQATFEGSSSFWNLAKRCSWLGELSLAALVSHLPWKNVAGGYRELDARIWFFTGYYAVSPGMFSKIPGKGAARS